jgi:hypothetical protein
MTFATTPGGSKTRAVQMVIDGHGNVGIGNADSDNPAPNSLAGTPNKLYVKGTIHSATGGFVFPDNTVQSTAYTGNGGVTSFNGRTGTVIPMTNDYSFPQITGTEGVARWPWRPSSRRRTGLRTSAPASSAPAEPASPLIRTSPRP